MKSSRLLAISAFIFLLNPIAAKADHDFAGYLREVTGDVKLTHAGTNVAKPAHIGDDIFTGDKIVTGDKSRVRMEFADDSDLVVAEHGKLTIDKYLYNPSRPKEGKAEFTLLDSAFSYASGWMDKGDKSDVKANLNYGSIGIRGTKLYRAMANKECWIYLEKGAIDVYNKGGKVTLAPGEGTIMKAKTVAPQAPHKWPGHERKWITAQVAGETSAWKP